MTLNETNWLRVPVGKLHTDRYVPLHPSLIDLHRTWRAWAGPDDTSRLISNDGRVLGRFSASHGVAARARIARSTAIELRFVVGHIRDSRTLGLGRYRTPAL